MQEVPEGSQGKEKSSAPGYAKTTETKIGMEIGLGTGNTESSLHLPMALTQGNH